MTYSVIYRTGGTENFKWNRVLETFKTREEANRKSKEIQTMGYLALVHISTQLDAIGLPETYEPGISVIMDCDEFAKLHTGRKSWEQTSANLERAINEIQKRYS